MCDVAHALMLEQVDRVAQAMLVDPRDLRAQVETWLVSPLTVEPSEDDDIREVLGLSRAS